MSFVIENEDYEVSWQLNQVGKHLYAWAIDPQIPKDSWRTIPQKAGIKGFAISAQNTDASNFTYLRLRYLAPGSSEWETIEDISLPPGETNYQRTYDPEIPKLFEEDGVLELIHTSDVVAATKQFELQVWLTPTEYQTATLGYAGDVIGGTPASANDPEGALPCASNPYFRKFLNKLVHLYDKSLAATFFSIVPYEFSGLAVPNETLQVWAAIPDFGQQPIQEKVLLATASSYTWSQTVPVQADGTYRFYMYLQPGKNTLRTQDAAGNYSPVLGVYTYKLYLWLCAYANEIKRHLADAIDQTQYDGWIGSDTTTPRYEALRDVWEPFIGLKRPSWMTDDEYETYIAHVLNQAFSKGSLVNGPREAVYALTGAYPTVFEDYIYQRGWHIGESYLLDDGQLAPGKYWYFVAAIDTGGQQSAFDKDKVLQVDTSFLAVENDTDYIDDRMINIINWGLQDSATTGIDRFRIFRGVGEIDLDSASAYQRFFYLAELANSSPPVRQTFFDNGTYIPDLSRTPNPAGMGPAALELENRTRTMVRVAQAMNNTFTVQVNLDNLYAKLLSLDQLDEAKTLIDELIKKTKRISHVHRISYVGSVGGYESGDATGDDVLVEHTTVARFPIVQFADDSWDMFFPDIVEMINAFTFNVQKADSDLFNWAMIGGNEQVYTKRELKTEAIAAIGNVVKTISHTLGVRQPLVQLISPSDELVIPDRVSFTSDLELEIEFNAHETGDWLILLMGGDPTDLFTVFRTVTDGSTTIDINHNLNNQYPLVQVLDDNGEIILPDDFIFTDADNSRVVLGESDTVRVIIIG